jgi:hypothetical protein
VDEQLRHHVSQKCYNAACLKLLSRSGFCASSCLPRQKCRTM